LNLEPRRRKTHDHLVKAGIDALVIEEMEPLQEEYDL
jgi:hypothetical protein